MTIAVTQSAADALRDYLAGADRAPHPRVSVVIMCGTRMDADWADGRGSGVGVGELP